MDEKELNAVKKKYTRNVRKVDHFHFQFNKFFSSLSHSLLLATHSKVFPCRKLKFFMKLQLKRAAASGWSRNILQITPIWLSSLWVTMCVWINLPVQFNWNKKKIKWKAAEKFVKHHNEPHYMKVIIFRDEIWFHDILTIKHKNYIVDVFSLIRTRTQNDSFSLNWIESLVVATHKREHEITCWLSEWVHSSGRGVCRMEKKEQKKGKKQWCG